MASFNIQTVSLPSTMISTDTKKEDVKEILYQCLLSTKTMGTVFFKHHCYRPFGTAHDPIFEILDDDSIKRGLIVCPRGWGKTTLMGLIFVAREILFAKVNYIVYISATASKAIADLQTLASELQTNEIIKKLFGDLRGVRWAEGTGELVVNVLGHEIKVEAKGAGGQIRGLKFKQFRPGLYIVDDLEDKEAVQNEDRRNKLKRWFFTDLLNSEDAQGSRVLVAGTILHEDALLNVMLDEEKWIKELEGIEDRRYIENEVFKSIRVEACNDALESTWPDYIPTDKIKARYKVYELRGILDEFYREFRNLIVPTEGGAFAAAYFKRYEEDWKTLNALENVVIVDPAKTPNPQSADSAIVGVGFDSVKNKIYFRDVVRGKMMPDQIYKEACDMADRLGTKVIGAEVTSLNMFITYPFRSYMATRPRYYELVELPAKGKKEDRIRALVPFYRMGAIEHNSMDHIRGVVEAQLLVFPNGRLVDVIDAFAYMIEMFDIGDRLFSFPIEESEAGKKLSKEETDEFAILKEGDYDKPFESSCVV